MRSERRLHATRIPASTGAERILSTSSDRLPQPCHMHEPCSHVHTSSGGLKPARYEESRAFQRFCVSAFLRFSIATFPASASPASPSSSTVLPLRDGSARWHAVEFPVDGRGVREGLTQRCVDGLRVTGAESWRSRGARHRVRRRAQCAAARRERVAGARDRPLVADARRGRAQAPGSARQRRGRRAVHAGADGSAPGQGPSDRPRHRARHLEPRALRRSVQASGGRSRTRKPARRRAVRFHLLTSHARRGRAATSGTDLHVHAVLGHTADLPDGRTADCRTRPRRLRARHIAANHRIQPPIHFVAGYGWRTGHLRGGVQGGDTRARRAGKARKARRAGKARTGA